MSQQSNRWAEDYHTLKLLSLVRYWMSVVISLRRLLDSTKNVEAREEECALCVGRSCVGVELPCIRWNLQNKVLNTLLKDL